MELQAMAPRSFSSDYYDTTRQHHAWWRNDSQELRRRQKEALKARLRFDYLFSCGVTLYRADVLDGACFMQSGITPDEICEWVATPKEYSPITVLTNTGALADDILEWVRLDEHGGLQAQPMLAIDPKYQTRLNSEIPRMKPTSMGNWKSFASAIETATGVEGMGDQLRSFWSSWIEAAPRLRVMRFQRPPPYEKYLQKQFEAADLRAFCIEPDSIEEREAVRLYAAAVEAFRAGGWKRGRLTEWLQQKLPSANQFVANVVENRLSIGVCRARAEANGTDHETILDTPLVENWSTTHGLRLLTDDPIAHGYSSCADAALPAQMGEWLIDCDYARLMRNVRVYRDAWLHEGTMSALSRLAERIGEEVAKDPGPLTVIPSEQSIWIARVVAGMGGAALVAVMKLAHPPLEWICDVTILGVASGTANMRQALTKATVPLARRTLVHQLVQTVRSRSIS